MIFQKLELRHQRLVDGRRLDALVKPLPDLLFVRRDDAGLTSHRLSSRIEHDL